MKQYQRKDNVVKLPDFKTRDELFSTLTKLHTERPMFINSAVTVSTEPIIQILTRNENSSVFKIEMLETNHDIHKFHIAMKSSRADVKYRAMDFYVVSGNDQKFDLFLTLTDPNSWKEVVYRYIKSLFPAVLQPFLKQQELRSILVRAEEKNVIEILIKTTASKRWYISGEKKGIASRRDWSPRRIPISVSDAFEEAQEESKWFKQLTFEIKKRNGLQANLTSSIGKLAKDGQVSFTSDFDIFWRSFVIPIGEIAQDRLKKFMNKSRKTSPKHRVSPITIEYPYDYFKNITERKNFIEIIKQMPRISYAVLHSNPHVHMSILDYIDGSAVDLWVLSSKKITLMPQIKTSEAALSRLVNYISERFYEGEVVTD